MPFSASQSGAIYHIKPYHAQRQILRGRLAEYAKGFFYVIYPESPAKTQAAHRAIERFFQEEMQARQDDYHVQKHQWQAQRAHQQQVEARAQRELSRRTTQHLCEILAMRGLNPNIPIHALWLPRPAKHPHSVAHGWGQAPVGTKQQ